MLRKIRNIFVKNTDSEMAEKRERKIFAKIYARKAKKSFDSGVRKMGTEAKETKEMAKLFFNLLEQKLNLKNRKEPPTKDEVKEAIEQLKDVGRVSFFATISILPGGAVSLIGIEMLAAKFGIKNFTFIPSSFRKNSEWHYPKGHRKKGKQDPQTLKEKN